MCVGGGAGGRAKNEEQTLIGTKAGLTHPGSLLTVQGIKELFRETGCRHHGPAADTNLYFISPYSSFQQRHG